MKRTIALALASVTVVAACSSTPSERVIVAAGTTVVDSGLLGLLVEAYVDGGGVGTVDVVALSSQQSLAYASAGNADITITHERDLLDAFLAETPEAVSSPVFTSRFVYVASPSIAFPRPRVEDILATVAADGLVFVTRDDGSGTHSKELEMWDLVGIDPVGEPWYVRTGTGMGETLLVADQKGGVTLSELGAYLAAADNLSLVKADDGSDPDLANPYDVTVVSPKDNEAAVEFFAWLTSDAGGSAIVAANEELFGTQVYTLP